MRDALTRRSNPRHGRRAPPQPGRGDDRGHQYGRRLRKHGRLRRAEREEELWWRRQYRELKKIRFLTPSKCPIDLYRLLGNRTTLKQIARAFFHSLKNGFSGTFSPLYALRRHPSSETDTSTSAPSPRHRSDPQVSQQWPSYAKSSQKSRARTPLWAARARLCPGFSGGINHSIISQRERRFGSSTPEPSMRPASWFTVDATLRALSTTAARAGPATRTRSST